VRVALVAIIADHPAMCKLCGFADKNHNAFPCPKCKVSQADFFSDKSLRNGNEVHWLSDILTISSRISSAHWRGTSTISWRI
jgi:hypothetical protein